jgi:hypothetical protein
LDRVKTVTCTRTLIPLLAAAAAALLAGLPAANAAPGAIVWNPPTRADHYRGVVNTGQHVSFALKASTSKPGATVRITAIGGLPQHAAISTTSGRVATASFQWTPSVGGDYTLRFGATAGRLSAPARTYTVHVVAKPYPLSNPKLAHWAPVVQQVVARSAPSPSTHAVATLDTVTSDKTQNIVLLLDGIDLDAHTTWYRVRLPILPNNSTGWVPASALGDVYAVHTHLYIDRAKFRATLDVDGRPVFSTIVGVGKTYWPTPTGEFYVRDKLTNFGNPFYGPVAFGTSARSAVLTDWPGGGFVGVHGTNEPDILPGRVSHGCVRMPNASILKLAKLMPVGTPVTIR